MATNTTPQQVEINAQVNWGLSEFTSSLLLNYQEPNTTTALFSATITVVVPINTTNNAYNLATLFPADNSPLLFGLADLSQPGQQLNWGLASSDGRFQMAPGGFALMRVNGGAPTIYVDNPSTTQPAVLQIFSLSN